MERFEMVTLKHIKMKLLSQSQNECEKWLGEIQDKKYHTGPGLQYIQPQILSLISNKRQLEGSTVFAIHGTAF